MDKNKDIILDDENPQEVVGFKELETPEDNKKVKAKKVSADTGSEDVINCLKNETITIKLVPKRTGIISNPKHVLFGGMAETARRVFVAPRLSSGVYVNILTDNEKRFLEKEMGLNENALSIYNKVNNFWDNSDENTVATVTLFKQDNRLDLSNPEDYIRYKILLANKDLICPSLEELENRPKSTYQYVIIHEGENENKARTTLDYTMRSYKEFGKIEDDMFTMRMVIETITQKPTAPTSKKIFLQETVDSLIKSDSKLFYKVITDPLLSTKVLIKRAVESGIISNRGNFLYLREDNSPLCEVNEEPVMNTAAKYLSAPKHQDLKLKIEAKLKD